MSHVWSRVVSVLIQGGLWGWETSKNYHEKLTTQRQKSFESHLSLTLMRVKLVPILRFKSWGIGPIWLWPWCSRNMTLHIGGINSSRINLSPEWGLRWYTCNKCLSSNPGPVALQLRVNWPFVLRWGLKGFATSIVNCDCDKGTYKYCDFLLRPYPPLTGIDYA